MAADHVERGSGRTHLPKVAPPRAAPAQAAPVTAADLLLGELEAARNPDPREAIACELLARYGERHADVKRAGLRVLAWAGELQVALSAAARAEDPVAAVMAPDVRRFTFMLEGLLRLYRDAYGKPVDKARRRVKELEDQLGALGHAEDMRAALAELPAIPAAAVAYWATQVRGERQRLAKLLADWLPGRRGRCPALARVVASLLTVDWQPAARDRRIVRDALVAQLDHIVDSDWRMARLQEGLHELRRQLRWPPIYGMGLGGAVVLSDELNPEPRYLALLRAPVARSPFAELPRSRHERTPLALSRTAFLRVTQLIDELGKLKDEGELIEGLARALRESDLAKKRGAEALALSLLGKPAHRFEEIVARAEVLYGEARHVARLFGDGLRGQ